MDIKLIGEKGEIKVDSKGIFIWVDESHFLSEYVKREELKELLSFISLTLGRLNRALGVVGIDKEKEEINKTVDNLIDDNKQLLEQRDKAHNNIVILTDKMIDLEMELNQSERDLVDEVKKKQDLKNAILELERENSRLFDKANKLEEEKQSYMELRKEGSNNE